MKKEAVNGFLVECGSEEVLMRLNYAPNNVHKYKITEKALQHPKILLSFSTYHHAKTHLTYRTI